MENMIKINDSTIYPNLEVICNEILYIKLQTLKEHLID